MGLSRFDVTIAAYALAIAATLAAGPAAAQTQQPPARPGQAPAQPPAVAPAKPYKPVAFKPPTPIGDASFAAFRKQIGDIATKKDRGGLARLIVAQGFFWEQEKGDVADKRRPGIDNLAKAIGLDAKDGSGWEMLGAYAADPTGVEIPNRKGVVCAPADPSFDEKELENLANSTQTDVADWGYPAGPDIEVRAAARPNAPVVEKLGQFFVRVLPDAGPGAPGAAGQDFIRVVTPSGKTGFVPAEAVIPLGNDQLCYVKDASGWKITGFIGGEQ
jgi:hypothetical protein